MSSRVLLSLSLGPVQDFIAQARRTRDLWYGSHLLSELSRAAAKAVAEIVVDEEDGLIFPPYMAGDSELEPCDGPVRPSGNQPAAVSNRILVVVPSPYVAEKRAQAARKAAVDRWRNMADKVREEMLDEEVLASGIDDIWEEQISGFIEFYAAWAPIESGFAETRKSVERTLAGSKALRDFSQWHHDGAGAPKSSLDGARVSVLNEDRAAKGFMKLRIGSSEHIDAIGLCKRAGGNPEQFVPLPNIAAAKWLDRVQEEAPEKLLKLQTALESGELADLGLRRLQKVHRNDLRAAKLFPFDASVLYPNRWHTLFEEINLDAGAREIARKQLEKYIRSFGDPPSYVACLVADGDNMGKALDALGRNGDSVGSWRKISKQLLEFSQQANQIVEECYGAPVYAGGDDVLAFLPVATVLNCAEELAKAFSDTMKEKDLENPPTLSVGIGIRHTIEAMGSLLELGREAERKAKNHSGKNALAVIFDKRSGGRREWACSWKQSPVCRLRKDATLLGDSLSSSPIYRAATLLRCFEPPSNSGTPPELTKEPAAAKALVAYTKQVFAHSEDGGSILKEIEKPEAHIFPDSSLTNDYQKTCELIKKGLQRLMLVRDLVSNGFNGTLRSESAE